MRKSTIGLDPQLHSARSELKNFIHGKDHLDYSQAMTRPNRLMKSMNQPFFSQISTQNLGFSEQEQIPQQSIKRMLNLSPDLTHRSIEDQNEEVIMGDPPVKQIQLIDSSHKDENKHELNQRLTNFINMDPVAASTSNTPIPQ